ncbi:MAG: efflux RND transporter periplasmic adaptor subunit [Proteobacteria bacterium]|nr:efflux RND transporter periplasmic adaptor subunit [Pseudomonadota bacterium]
MRKFLPVIIILALLGAGAFYWFYYKPKHENTPIKLFGNVEIREAEASFRQAGRIKNILVDEGDKVQEGQVLAELETDTFMDAMAASDAEIALANSDLTKLKNGSRPEEIALANDNVAQAKAVLDNAQKEYARQASLAPSGAVAQKIVDNLKSQRDIARANYQAALDALKLRQNGARKEDIMAGQSRLQGAMANRRKIQTALDDTKLYAPVSGIIVAKPKEKGAIVAPNLAVFTISIQDPIYIRAYVSEKELAKFAPGTQVLIKSDSIDKEYQGQVGYVSPRAEFTPKTVETQDLRTDLVYRLRIVVKSPDGKLLQGMPVNVRLANEAAK